MITWTGNEDNVCNEVPKKVNVSSYLKHNAFLVADKVLRNREYGGYDDERNCRAGSVGTSISTVLYCIYVFMRNFPNSRYNCSLWVFFFRGQSFFIKTAV